MKRRLMFRSILGESSYLKNERMRAEGVELSSKPRACLKFTMDRKKGTVDIVNETKKPSD